MDEEMRKLSIAEADADANSSIPNDNNPWNKLDDVIVETVLARLLTADILSCQFVCKRWYSIIHCSPTFSITSKQLFNRRPWFFMFNTIRTSLTSVVYDMEVSDWRHVYLRVPPTTTTTITTDHKVITRPAPVASSGGLICFDRSSGTDSYSCIVNNPLTGVSRSLPNVKTYGELRGIAMHASKSNYKIFVVYGNWPYLVLKVFSSEEANWKLLRTRDVTDSSALLYDPIDWSPVEGITGVTTSGNEGQILVHYLVRSYPSRGRLICFDTLKGTFFVSPRLIDTYSLVDLVECGGRVFAVVKEYDYRGYYAIFVWEFDHEKPTDCWKYITVKPLEWYKPVKHTAGSILKEYIGLDKNINCSGHGDHIMVCLNFLTLIALGHLNHVLVYNIKENTWAELPPCFDPDDGRRIWFASPYLFEPEIGAKV